MAGAVSERRLWLDACVGERRAVVTPGGRSERLVIERETDLAVQRLGARLVARVHSVDRGQALAFVDLGEGPDAVLNLGPGVGPIVDGGWAEVEVRAENRREKGARVRWLGEAEGPGRLLAPGPSLEERLGALVSGAPLRPVRRRATSPTTPRKRFWRQIFPCWAVAPWRWKPRARSRPSTSTWAIARGPTQSE